MTTDKLWEELEAKYEAMPDDELPLHKRVGDNVHNLSHFQD
jgi:hypothetical protein